MTDPIFGFRDHRVVSGGRRVEVAFTDGRSDLRGDARGFGEQFARLEAAVGLPVLRSTQIHRDDVREVSLADHVAAGEATATADALLTRHSGIALMTRAADCVPLLLADLESGLLAAVHSGRPGTALGIATRAVERMRALGAERIVGWIGPHICGACYEVPQVMQAEVVARVPATYATTRHNTPALDIGAGVRAQLEEAEVEVAFVGRCTVENADLPSYRRDGEFAGRLAGLIWMTP